MGVLEMTANDSHNDVGLSAFPDISVGRIWPRAGVADGPSATGGRALFWSGLALGVAGVTTSVLGLTVFRTEDSSTGNAPAATYAACVAQKNSDSIYATNQCDGLKGKNLTLLWGGVALSGVGAVLMIRGSNTSANLSPTSIGLFHRWHS
jgi:hypothetical protein